jgi:hypothetical protein
VGVGASGRGVAAGGREVFADVECLAERAAIVALAGSIGGRFHIYPDADFCDNRGVANHGPRMAGYIVLAAGGLFDRATCCVRQFDSISGAGDASVAGVGGRGNFRDYGMGTRDEGLVLRNRKSKNRAI